MLNIVSLLLVLTAVFAYLTHRYTKLPTTIGVMASALLLSLALAGLDKLGLSALKTYEVSLLKSIDFSAVLLQGMLSLLLFAGALHVDLRKLRKHLWQVGALALLGTMASTLLIGLGCYYLLGLAGIELSPAYCLLFGALISPTDPIAVLGILKSAKVPESLEITMTGESLLNDGVGVVLFALLLEMITRGTPPTVMDALELFGREAVGGALFGLVVGYVAYRMLKKLDNYQIEVLITLATVMGGYALANELHVSGPIAMVVVGLLIGNQGRALAMSAQTREYLDMFWELIDEILNGVLFVLMGLEIAVIAFPDKSLLAAIMIIAVTLAARFLVAGAPVAIWHRWFALPRGSALVLTWGGLRGGISVALALSLPPGRESEVIVMLTYSVVLFSIIGQGLTVGALARAATRGR